MGDNFTLETSIIDEVYNASGYYFHILKIKDHRYWIAQELSHALDYIRPGNMLRILDEKKIHKKLLMQKEPKGANEDWHKNRVVGLDILITVLKRSSTLHKDLYWNEMNIARLKRLGHLMLAREDTIIEYLGVYVEKSNAMSVGKELYNYFLDNDEVNEVEGRIIVPEWSSIPLLEKIISRKILERNDD